MENKMFYFRITKFRIIKPSNFISFILISFIFSTQTIFAAPTLENSLTTSHENNLSARVEKAGTSIKSSTEAKNIFDTSIAWDDEQARIKLLNAAPQWDNAAMQALFIAYLNPQKYELETYASTQSHNLQFINVFWGPLNNPYNKYPRPVKAFLFTNPSDQNKFDMAPLIKNASDGNYYIFDKNQKHPLLLNEWISNIQRREHLQTSIRFNICNGYANYPKDTCNQQNFRSEAYYIDAKQERLKSAYYDSFTPQILSAHRDLKQDWKSKLNNTKLPSLNTNDSINQSSISWKDQEQRNKLLNTVVAWSNYKTIKENFEKIRNLRYFSDPQILNFSRRISWLFPDDGCWTRASAAIRDLFGPFNNFNNELPRPSKVFAFGNLCANTNNAPEGSVYWWYHTAPIVRDASTNQTYVLDPSINASMPMTMEKWAEAIASRSGACKGSASYLDKFNVCNGYGTTPYSTCQSTIKEETKSMLMQANYQMDERYRQTQMGRNADLVLGDTPPWES
jgi:hypothetical protein